VYVHKDVQTTTRWKDYRFQKRNSHSSVIKTDVVLLCEFAFSSIVVVVCMSMFVEETTHFADDDFGQYEAEDGASWVSITAAKSWVIFDEVHDELAHSERPW
jgi:hypothetical protein